jgi:hypothetical protein
MTEMETKTEALGRALFRSRIEKERYHNISINAFHGGQMHQSSVVRQIIFNSAVMAVKHR